MIIISDKEKLEYLIQKSDDLVEGIPFSTDKQRKLGNLEVFIYLFMIWDNKLWTFNKTANTRQKWQKLFVDSFSTSLEALGITLNNPRKFFLKRVTTYIRLKKENGDCFDFMSKLMAHIIEHSTFSQYNPYASPAEMVPTCMDMILLYSILSPLRENISSNINAIGREMDYDINGGPDRRIIKDENLDSYHENDIDEPYYEKEPWYSFLKGKSGKRLNQAKTIVDELVRIIGKCGASRIAINSCYSFLNLIQNNDGQFQKALDESKQATDIWICFNLANTIKLQFESAEYTSQLFGLLSVYKAVTDEIEEILSKRYGTN